MASKTDAGPSSTKVLAEVPSNPDNAGAWLLPSTVMVIVLELISSDPPAWPASCNAKVRVSKPLKSESGR